MKPPFGAPTSEGINANEMSRMYPLTAALGLRIRKFMFLTGSFLRFPILSKRIEVGFPVDGSSGIRLD
jgi:hypothetical protein